MKGNEINKSRRPRLNEIGSAVLEFGLVVVMFFMFVFGVMDFGRALYTYHFVSNAACEATRYAIVRGSSSTEPVTASDIQAYVKSITPEGVDPNQLTITTTWSPDKNPGSTVKVQVSDNFQFMTPVLASYQMNFSDSSQMVISQ
ncbi:MAG TPA: TadE/TadG family type IV pilus assembly protein [Terriglobia bacterium]|nr:TadE/TadG family type IV pilus assembly protein [Terriglobia bacterium]